MFFISFIRMANFIFKIFLHCEVLLKFWLDKNFGWIYTCHTSLILVYSEAAKIYHDGLSIAVINDAMSSSENESRRDQWTTATIDDWIVDCFIGIYVTESSHVWKFVRSGIEAPKNPIGVFIFIIHYWCHLVLILLTYYKYQIALIVMLRENFFNESRTWFQKFYANYIRPFFRLSNHYLFHQILIRHNNINSIVSLHYFFR